MSEEEKAKWLQWLSKAWKTITTGLQKTYRGLLCEKKEGGWELSKGNVAFWLVLIHCMYVWSGKAAVSVVKSVADAAGATDAPAPAVVEGAEAAAASLATDSGSLFQSMAEMLGTAGLGEGVPDQEFYFLMALLFYSILKLTKGSLTDFMGAVRGVK